MSALKQLGNWSTVQCLCLCLLCTNSCFAETLTFEALLSEAENQSFDLKIAEENTLARQAYIDEAKADYYPQLSIQIGSEYVHVFEESSDIVSVGDAIIANNSSGYKHSLIAGLRYNLFDFGVRKLSVDHARRQRLMADLQKQKTLLDVRNELLNSYTTALKLQKQILTTETILDRLSTVFRLNRKLKKAGTVGQEQVGAAALVLAETINRLDDLKLQFQDALNRLSFFTQKNYQGANVYLSDFSEIENINTVGDPNSSAEVRAILLEIENKKVELDMALRATWPKLALTGAYRMFGGDDDSFARSISSMNSRDASITLYLDWPLFTGFENRAKRSRLKHELTSLQYQRQKKVAELHQEFSGIVNAHNTYRSVRGDRQKQLIQLSYAQANAEQLVALQVNDQISFHNKIIELTKQRLSVELWQVDSAAVAHKLRLLAKVMP